MENRIFSSNEIIENCKQRKYTLLTKIKQKLIIKEKQNEEFFSEIEKQIIVLFDAQKLLKDENRYEESKTVNELIIELIDSFKQTDIFTINIKYIKAFCLFEIGYFYLTKTKQYEEASDNFALSCTYYESLGDNYAYELASSQTNCSYSLYLLNKIDESISYAENSYSIIKSLVSFPQKKIDYDDLYQFTCDLLSVLYIETGRKEESKQIIESKVSNQFPIINEEKIIQNRSITPPSKLNIEQPISLISTHSNPRMKKRISTSNPRPKRFTSSSENFSNTNKSIFNQLEKSINDFFI